MGDWKLFPSPDGKRVVITYFAFAKSPYSSNVLGSLFLVDWDGKVQQTLDGNTQPLSNAAWSPDGSAFAIAVDNVTSEYLEVFANDGSIIWQTDTLGFLNPDPESVVWTRCK